MFRTEKEFEDGVTTAVEVLKETYIGNIMHVQERVKAKAEEDELKTIEEIILAAERLIIYFEKSDEWVKNLHDEAKGGSDGSSDDGLGGDDSEAEVARIEEARNS